MSDEKMKKKNIAEEEFRPPVGGGSGARRFSLHGLMVKRSTKKQALPLNHRQTGTPTIYRRRGIWRRGIGVVWFISWLSLHRKMFN